MTKDEIRKVLASKMPGVELVDESRDEPDYVWRSESGPSETGSTIVLVRSSRDPRRRTRSVIISASGDIIGAEG